MTTIDVTNTDDSGPGSLRDAVNSANSNSEADTIVFDSSLSGETIALTGDQLEITTSVTIDGDLNDDSDPDITIDGQSSDRVFKVDDGTVADDPLKEVTLQGLVIQRGKVNDKGGGIKNEENLTLASSIVRGNRTTGTESAGGIVNGTGGVLSIINSTIDDNYASAGAGGILSFNDFTLTNSTVSNNSARFEAGGVENNGPAVIRNSTISGNTAGLALDSVEGGGIKHSDQTSGTSLTLANSTVSGNSAPNGGGIYNDSGSTTTLTNSIIANNDGDDVVNDPDGVNDPTIETTGTNLIEDGSFDSGDSNIIQKDPQLGPLQDNGGPTKTQAPQSGSPALDAGVNSEIPSDAQTLTGDSAQDLDGDGNTFENIPYDQRGEGFPRIEGDTVDLGAFEVAVNDPPQVSNPIDQQEATLGEAFSFPVPGDTFNDPDDSSLELSASLADGSDLPEWLSFNADNRTLSGTPSEGDTGTLNLQLTATDAEGATASTEFQLAVAEPQNFSLDVDGNGEPEALADGILVTRFLFGFSGQTLTQGAVGEGASRSEAAQVTSFLNDAGDALDVDGNGETEALTDGILLTRFLFGFSGQTLTQGAIGEGASRSSPDAIASHLEQFQPSGSSALQAQDLSAQIPELAAQTGGSQLAQSDRASSQSLGSGHSLQPEQVQSSDGLTASA